MQYEIVFKGDGCCSCYTCLLRTAPAAAQTAQKMAPGTGTDASPVTQRLLTIATPKQVHNIYIHANNSKKKLRNNTSIHKNSALNYSNTVLRVTTIAWI